jgi:hypothetical protein
VRAQRSLDDAGHPSRDAFDSGTQDFRGARGVPVEDQVWSIAIALLERAVPARSRRRRCGDEDTAAPALGDWLTREGQPFNHREALLR